MHRVPYLITHKPTHTRPGRQKGRSRCKLGPRAAQLLACPRSAAALYVLGFYLSVLCVLWHLRAEGMFLACWVGAQVTRSVTSLGASLTLLGSAPRGGSPSSEYHLKGTAQSSQKGYRRPRLAA